MAAAVTTVAIVAAGSSQRGPWDEDSADIGGRAFRWAYVACTMDAGTYPTAGNAVDILGALDDIGWTVVTGGIGMPYTTNSVISRPELGVAPSHATPASRTVMWRLTTTGAEVANGVTHTAGTYYMMVFGY